MRISDGRCERYIFDQNLKLWMRSNGEDHDGMRRCLRRADWHDPKRTEFLCTFHFNRMLRVRSLEVEIG